MKNTLRPSALLIDFDGVIADSESLHAKAWNNASIKILEKPLTGEMLHRLEGLPTHKISAMLTGEDSQHPLSLQLAAIKWDEMKALAAEVTLFRGAADLLTELHASEIPHAIVTSSPRSFVEDVLTCQSIRPPLTIGREQVTAVKPSPECFFVAAKALGLALDLYKSVCVIEDSFHGMLAAKRAKMIGVGVTNTFSADYLLQAGAKLIVKDLEEFWQKRLHLGLPLPRHLA